MSKTNNENTSALADKDIKWNVEDFFPDKIHDAITPKEYVVESPYTVNGRKLYIKMRELTAEEVERIRDKYTKRVFIRDEKGKLVYRGGRVPVSEEVADETAILRHQIAESFVFPNLKDVDLQLKYNASGHVDLLNKMFPMNPDIKYLTTEWQKIQLRRMTTEPETQEEIAEASEAAKN